MDIQRVYIIMLSKYYFDKIQFHMKLRKLYQLYLMGIMLVM